MTNKKSFNVFHFLIATIVCCLPFLRYYDVLFVSVSMESALMLFVGLLCLTSLLIGKKDALHSSSKKSVLFFSLFLLYFLLNYVINIAFRQYQTESMNAFLFVLVIGFLIICFYLLRIDKRMVFSIYSFFVWFCIVVYLVQLFLSLIGQHVNFKLPFHSFSEPWIKLSTYCFGMNDAVPTSIFAERAHFCEYIVPYICFCIFSKQFVSKARFTKAIIVSLIVLSTISGNGVVLVAIIWLMYFLFFSNLKKTRKVILIFSGACLFVIAYLALSQLTVYSKLFNTLFVNRTGTSTWTKADYRVYRGFDFFFRMPVEDKIIGIGYRTISYYSTYTGIVSKYDSDALYSYLSGITQLLIYFGVFGMLLFYIHLYYLQKNQANIVKALIILYVATSFSSEVFFDTYHLLFAFLAITFLERRRVFVCDAVF